MPVSLNLRSIGVMIAGSALCAVLFMQLSRPTPLIPLVMGVVFGAVVGVVHGKSITVSSQLLRTAHSSVEVHHALMSTRSGQCANAIHWISVLVVAGVAIWQGSLLGAFAGLSAFECSRDTPSLRAVMRFHREFRAVEQ